jgi:hypothetical protein
MGRFKEYLVMAKNGMKNISNVAEGNFNLLIDTVGLLPQDQQDEADRRYSICAQCPFMSLNAKTVGFYDTMRTDQHCSVCKCPIEAKVMAFHDSCGLSLLVERFDENGNQIGGLNGFKTMWGPYVPEK